MTARRVWTTTMIVGWLTAGSAMWAQSGRALPIPGVEPARDVPGAHEVPDAATVYKVVFDIDKGAAKPTDINPGLQGVARYVNTLAKVGVPADHRKIAVVFHQGSTDIVMNNDSFKARYEGQDNPNLALIHAMKEAGVELHVCGQALYARKIDPKIVNPDIQVDLWALTTLVNLETRGYVRVGN